MKVSKNREKKQEIVKQLAEKVSKSKAMVFTNYQGMTHKQMEGLKKALRKTDAELIVAKNTLLKRSLACPTWEEELTKGPTATLFAYSDIIAPLKELAKIIKNLKLPAIKFGIMDNQALTSDQLLKLASLPSREVLIAQVVGGMKAPIYGLHRALNYNLVKLVMTLGAIQKTKV